MDWKYKGWEELKQARTSHLLSLTTIPSHVLFFLVLIAASQLGLTKLSVGGLQWIFFMKSWISVRLLIDYVEVLFNSYKAKYFYSFDLYNKKLGLVKILLKIKSLLRNQMFLIITAILSYSVFSNLFTNKSHKILKSLKEHGHLFRVGELAKTSHVAGQF